MSGQELFMDTAFVEKLSQPSPHFDPAPMFAGKPGWVESTAFRHFPRLIFEEGRRMA